MNNSAVVEKDAVSEKIAAAGKARKPVDKFSLGYRIKENRACYFMMAPFLIIFFVFTVLPVVISIGLSFTYFNMLQAPSWVGLLNYETLFVEDSIFLITVRNTLVFGMITGPVSYILCFVFAWMINDLHPKVRTILTVILYAPSISGGVYTIWQFIFSSDQYGLVNSFLIKLGIMSDPILWFQDSRYVLTIIIIIRRRPVSEPGAVRGGCHRRCQEPFPAALVYHDSADVRTVGAECRAADQCFVLGQRHYYRSGRFTVRRICGGYDCNAYQRLR